MGVSDLPFASAGEAARAIRQRDVSSRELTDFILSRIETYNSEINAIVVPLFEKAQARAKEADDALSRGELWGPLHGVPITVKESYDVAGVPTTAGNPAFSENVPQRNAAVVDRLLDAGAILLGKTNVPFMLSDWQAFNELYGATKNPWNLDRTPGGSTGGGAAALATGLSYLSVGGDLGGSIRVPAHFCGVFCHKPSRKVVPHRGHVPPPPGSPPMSLPNLETKGPLARSAADLKTALQVLGGPNAEEDIAFDWSLPPARGARLQDYRLGYVLDHPQASVSPDVKEVLRETIAALRKAGATLEEGWPEGVDPVQQRDTYLSLLELYIPQDFTGDGKMTGQASYEDVQAVTSKQLVSRRAWGDYFRTHDGFLMPTSPIPAFLHDHNQIPLTERVLTTPQTKVEADDMMFWTNAGNLLGFPATVAPVGQTPDGLPVGTQILGPYLEDATPIAVAGHVADVMGGFRAPDGYEG